MLQWFVGLFRLGCFGRSIEFCDVLPAIFRIIVAPFSYLLFCFQKRQAIGERFNLGVVRFCFAFTRFELVTGFEDLFFEIR